MSSSSIPTAAAAALPAAPVNPLRHPSLLVPGAPTTFRTTASMSTASPEPHDRDETDASDSSYATPVPTSTPRVGTSSPTPTTQGSLSMAEPTYPNVVEIEAAKHSAAWGRVLIAGGTDWASNGRKVRPKEVSETDLVQPHILRSICNVKVRDMITSPAANYVIIIDIHGGAYLFGKPPVSAMATMPDGTISEYAPVKIRPRDVGLPSGARWEGGYAARSHMFLIDSLGQVWGCGNNTMGQLGLPPSVEVESWTKITGPWLKEENGRIQQVAAGLTFSLFLTTSGQVYAAGSSECGQLGNGKSGERALKNGKTSFDTELPFLVQGALAGKHVTRVDCGTQHAMALDKEGFVYAWGFGGYSRLGLGDTKDRLTPTLIPSFAGKEATRAMAVLCGPTCSVVITKSRVFYMAGKWKITGDGSVGQPYSTFRPIQDIMGCPVLSATCGGCTFVVSALGSREPPFSLMTIGFGQGALNGELGLGEGEGKSTTRPMEIKPLSDVHVIDVAGGAYFTLFLAEPNSQLSELPRWPVHVETPSLCVVCNEHWYDDMPLECEKCDLPYHMGCLDPPLQSMPEDEWFCPQCAAEADVGPDEDVRIVGKMKKVISSAQPGPKRPRQSGGATRGGPRHKRLK